jgi:hypothetical protein
MAFTVPTFNLVCNVWTNPGPPGAPRLSPACNLQHARRVFAPSEGGTFTLANPWISMFLLVAKGTDIRDQYCPSGQDVIECPQGSGRMYYCVHVDDVGKGFTNEFRCCVIAKLGSWPQPIP